MNESWIQRQGTRPTIVFQSGFGDGKAVWTDVIDALHGEALFAYDRPGYGAHPASDTPRDPCTIAEELRLQLHAAGHPPPYLLVGHSLGGLYQYVFARLHPGEVAGLVLLDPTHPAHWESLQRDVPTWAHLVKGMRALAFSVTERREFDAQTACLDRLDASRPLAVPTRLLVSGRFKPIEQGDFAAMVKRLRLAWLDLVSAPGLATIHDAGHYIQRDAPDEVVTALRSVLNAPRVDGTGKSPWQPVGMAPEGMVYGQTGQEEILQRYGTPNETQHEPEGEVWIYNRRLELPLAVSLIPVVGDVADVIELLWNLPNDSELIVQFDLRGKVKKASRRKLD